jgi:hypothetical protein
MRSHSPPNTGAVTAAKSQRWPSKALAPQGAVPGHGARIRRPNRHISPGRCPRSGCWRSSVEIARTSGGATAWSRDVAVTSAAGGCARLRGLHRRRPPPGRGMLPLSQLGVCARRPTAPATRPTSDLPEAVGNPANSRTPPSRRCSREGSVRRFSSRPRARAVRDGAASGCAPCLHALRMRRGPEPTAPHGSRSRESRRRAWCRP